MTVPSSQSSHSPSCPPGGPSRRTLPAFAPKHTLLAVALHAAMAAMAIGLVALPHPALAQERAGQGEGSRRFDIPAGPLNSALDRFARAAGVNLSYDPALITGRSTPGLAGQYGIEAALQALLAGTDIEARAQSGGGFVLRRMPVLKPGAGEAVLAPVAVVARQDGDTLPGAYAGGQVARGGRLGLLGNRNFMETPFNQTSYTAQVMEEQQVRSLSDLLINDPSVRLSSARTNINEDFAIRGFTVGSQDVAFNGMYGLMPYYRVPVEMAERVEVLKGPSSLLNGMPPSGNVGGAINITPKRAGQEPLTRVTASYVSDSMAGTHVDIGRRFGEDKQFGVRFNGAYRSGDTNIDRQQQTDQAYSLGLDYQGERLRASLDLLHQDQDIDRVVRQFQAGAGLTAMPKAPDASLNYPGYGRSRTTDKMIAARAEYDINEQVTVYGGIGNRKHTLDAMAGNVTLLNGAGDFTSTPAWQIFKVDSLSYEAGTHIRFNTAGVSHQLTANYSRVEQNTDIFFDPFSWGARNSNIYHPVYSDMPSIAGLSANMVKYNRATLSSHALADTLGFFEDRLKVTLGARRQNVAAQGYNFMTGAPEGQRYDQAKVTPVLGVVYQPRHNLSLYANYIEGLSQGPVAPPGTSNQGTLFPPLKTKQYEAGVKADWGSFATTFSLFQIERPSAFTSGGAYGINGEQRNRGAEFNVFGEVARDVRLLGGLTLMQGRLTKTEAGAFDGNDAVAVPKTQLNLGVDWDNSLAPGVGLNARVVHTGSMFGDQANRLEMPAWTRVDVGARYRTRFNDKPLTLRANVENLFDKAYWSSSNEGYIYVGMPRTVMLSATVDF